MLCTFERQAAQFDKKLLTWLSGEMNDFSRLKRWKTIGIGFVILCGAVFLVHISTVWIGSDADFSNNEGIGLPVVSVESSHSMIQEGDWVIYRNNDYEFEIQLPVHWTIDQERSTSNEVVFDTGNLESREAISFEQNVNDLSAADWLEQHRRKYQDNILSERVVMIGGVTATRIETGDFGLTYYFLSTPEHLFVITTMGLLDRNGLSEFRIATRP